MKSQALDGRWVNSQDVEVGDVVCLRHRGFATIQRVSQRLERTRVCNLTVNDLHTFAVGEIQLLVHNSSASELAAQVAQAEQLVKSTSGQEQLTAKAILGNLQLQFLHQRAVESAIITKPGVFSTTDLAATLKGITDPTSKRIAISGYLQALKNQQPEGKFNFTHAVTPQGGVVIYGTGAGSPNPAKPIRNVIYFSREGNVHVMTLQGLNAVDMKRPVPIVNVNLEKGSALEITH